MTQTMRWLVWLQWFETRNGYRPKRLRMDRSTVEQLMREARMPVDWIPPRYLQFDSIPVEVRA